jgi:PqqD family protein of HPr-rel-A system
MQMAAPVIQYLAEPADQRLIEPLDQMTLIYQRRSGITHIVSEPVPQILAVMGEDALSAGAVMARLAADFDLDAADEALQAITARLEELADLGLLERIADA